MHQLTSDAIAAVELVVATYSDAAVTDCAGTVEDPASPLSTSGIRGCKSNLTGAF